MSMRDPGPRCSASLSISFAVLTKRIAATATMAVPTTMSVNPATLPKRRRGNLQEQIEPLHQESERHHGDGGANPGEERPLVGSMITVAANHENTLLGAQVTSQTWSPLSRPRQVRQSWH